MIEISVNSKKFSFHMTIKGKYTIICGDSGIGKSWFAQAEADVGGAYEIAISDPSYELVLPSNKNWHTTISRNIEYGDKCIYIIDDADYVLSSEFTQLAENDAYGFYIIINRFESFDKNVIDPPQFRTDEVYSFAAEGREHYLRKKGFDR